MINLSSSQKKIVQQSIGKSIQVLASAGTGKTRVLTERIRYILKNTKKDCIIALTFTNKAAEEMRERLENTDEAVDRCWIATIHSVAQRVVEQYAHTIGLPSELHIYERDQDRKTIFLQSLFNSNINIESLMRNNNDRNKTIQRYMNKFSEIKKNLLTENEIKQSYKPPFFSIFKNYQEELLASGGIDFDDILVYAHRIFIDQTWCAKIYRAKYKHICVDEAQDLNKAQYEFIKAFAGEEITSIMMTGDPDQMIYGFNGSSEEYLCNNFVKDFFPLKFTLKENYRSSKSVISLANKLKPDSQVESDFALTGEHEIQSFINEEEEAKWISNKIVNILKLKKHSDIEGPISLQNIVIIARNRFIFRELENSLKEMSISYLLKQSKSGLEPISLFGKVLDLSIRLKLNPMDWIDGKKLCELLKIDIPNKWGNESILNDLASCFRNSDILFPELQKKILIEIHSVNIENPNMLKLFNSLDKSLREIAISIQNTHLEKELELSMQELNEFRKYWNLFKRKKQENSLLSFRNAMTLRELITDENGYSGTLTLSTVHTMKGLEKDIVFLMGMCEGVFPDYRARSQKELEEEKNNAFVAVTRSRRWIYITYPKKRKMPWGDIKIQDESRFITEMRRTS